MTPGMLQSVCQCLLRADGQALALVVDIVEEEELLRPKSVMAARRGA